MGLSLDVDPKLLSLLTAVGLLDAGGGVDGSWFEHPLDGIRRCLKDPAQRAALLQLLADALPPVTGPLVPPGSRWHPLLEANRYGNVYLTVTGDVIGVAASVATTWAGPPGVGLVLTLPLVDTRDGELSAIAGSPQAPLEINLAVDLGADAGPASVGVRAAIDTTGGLRMRIRLEEAGSPRAVAEFDPTRLDAETVAALQLLLSSVLEQETDLDPRVQRVVHHLPGVLGLGDAALPPFPLADLAAAPDRARAWLAGIASSPAALRAWFGHVAGLLGGEPLTDDDGEPVLDAAVTGTGEVPDPLRSTLLDLGDGVTLDLTLAYAGPPESALRVGVALTVPAGPGRLEVLATIAGLPLSGTAPATVLPAADVRLQVPVSGGVVEGGARWDGNRVAPVLGLRGVVVAGTPHTLDLTDAHSVVAGLADTVAGALTTATGGDGTGRRVLALLGLVPPAGATGWTYALGPELFSGNPLRAVGEMHRIVLADPLHPWSHLFGELTGLLGLPGEPAGTGIRDDPWRVLLVGTDAGEVPALGLQIVAWDDRDAGIPAGTHLLRLGLRAVADLGGWQAAWSCELVGFDLAPDRPATPRFVGAQQLSLSALDLPVLGDGVGISVSAERIDVIARWAPGSRLAAHAEVAGLVLSAAGAAGRDVVGPVTLILPPAGALDLAQPDLGLGLPADTVPDLLRLLLSRALALWGDDLTAHVLGGLLGIHCELAGLPADWPGLIPATGAGLVALLRDPLAGLAAHVRAVTTGVSRSGEPFAAAGLSWLAALLSGALPDDPQAAPSPSALVTGSGGYDDPWALPLLGSAEQSIEQGPDAEVLVWVDPAPARPDHAQDSAGLRAAVSGPDLLGRLAAVPELAGPDITPAAEAALYGRDPGTVGAALDELSAWLAGGDGLVPYTSATAVPAGWTVGVTLSCPHGALPADPVAVQQVATQLGAWGAGPGCPVLLLSTATGDRGDWDAVLAAVEPGHDPDARADLRGVAGGQVGDRLAGLTASATCYPVLLDGSGDGDLDALVAQLDLVVARVRALTAAPRVCLVGHGPGGVVARVAAARTPGPVRGVVTLGAPHAGSDLVPLVRPETAEATRLARILLATPAGAQAATAQGAAAQAAAGPAAALDALVQILDGGPARQGVLPPAGAFSVPVFAAMPALPAGTVETVPGLALASRLGGPLVPLLAAACADRLDTARRAAAAALAAAGGVSHVGLGLRLPIGTAPGEPGGLDLRARVRLDVTRIRVGPGPEPDRPRQRLAVRAGVGRSGGWLVGDPGARADAASAAVLRGRWAELAVSVDRAATGGVAVRASSVLHEAGIPGTSAASVPLADLVAAVQAQQGSPQPQPVQSVLDFLRALEQNSAAQLGAQLPALLAMLLPGLGATAVPGAAGVGDGWRVPLLGGTAELLLTPGPWTLRLRTAVETGVPDGGGPDGGNGADGGGADGGGADGGGADGGGADGGGTASGLAGRVAVEASLSLPAFAAAASVTVSLGALELAWSSATSSPGTLDLRMPPWLPALRLVPPPPGQDVADAVLAALPRALLSAALAIFVQPLLGDSVRAIPLDLLLLAPGEWLRRPEGLGAAGGHGIDAAKLDTLLGVLSSALGQAAGAGGLVLPGELAVRATAGAAGTTELRLSGTVAIDADTALGFGLGVDIAAGTGDTLTVSPAGTVSIDVTLPGAWGGLRINAGADAAGLSLSVAPRGGLPPPPPPIELLPHFGGLGALAAAAARLLPHVLQQLLNEVRPAAGPPTGLLAAVLSVAMALDVYAEDAQGFEEPGRAERLAAMLDPDWWQARANDPAALATLLARLAALFGPPPLVPLPLGAIDVHGQTVRWSVPLPVVGGTLAASLGWTAAGEPVLALTGSALDLGPVVLDTAAIGFDGQLSIDITVHLSVDGLLAPVQPAVEIGLHQGRFRVRLVPLGTGTEDDFAVDLAPVLGVVATPQAAADLVERWGIPLAAEVLLRAIDGATPPTGSLPLLQRPLWRDGPTAAAILTASGLVTLGGGPGGQGLRIVTPLPDLVPALLRALQAAATGVAIRVTTELELALVSEPVQGGTRTGIRLRGRADIETDDILVSLRFGDASWLPDADAGITVWLLEPAPAGPVPLQLTAALSVVGLGVVLSGPDGGPLVDGAVVIGAAGGLVFFEAAFLDAARQPELNVTGFGAGVGVQDAFVNLSSDDADSFLAKVLPPQLRAPFDLAVVYRDGQLRIEGTSPLSTGRIELVIPLDLDLTVIQITELLLALQIGGGAVSLEAALSGGAHLGPIQAVVRRVGLIATFSTGASGTAVGLRLRAPDMVGLSIDTSTLRLGGFLLVDQAHGRYIGAIEIALLGKFELAAVGVITTMMPDGSPGFSLLFIISIVFPVPITLGYGFFFAGAGGLLGLNRSVDLDRLRIGLRAGTADSILFPSHVVERAEAIVRDLEEVFPVARGQFLVGPMALITWSTPPLISLKIGVILELGTPIRVAILGVLRAALPDASDPVLDLKVAFLGTIDIAAGLLTFDAAIYDSYLGSGDYSFSIEGDIAVRVSWSAQPDFVTSVGGFHPDYIPAAHLKLPKMRRVSISLLKDNPRLTMSTYFAITSNTVQLGARLDFALEVSGFSVVGDFGFDVLFQFSPFRFDAHLWARLAVKSGGTVLLSLSLDFTLRGPTPWIARGTASFKVLFFTVNVEFEKRFGVEDLGAILLVALLPKIIEEFSRPENWEGRLSAGASVAVALLPLPSNVIDAGGTLTVSQRVLPLGTEITQFGTSQPSDLIRVEVAALRIGTQVAQTEEVAEPFSPAAFRVMSDADKLRATAFEPRPSGVRAVSGTGLRTNYVLARPAHYDLIVMDSAPAPAEVRLVRSPGRGAVQPAAPLQRTETRLGPQPEPAGQFQAQARGGAAGRSVAARANRWRSESGLVLAATSPQDRFAVTRTDDLRPLDDLGAPVDATGTDPAGNPVFPAGALVQRSDAQARLAALAGAGGAELAAVLQILPASQLVPGRQAADVG